MKVKITSYAIKYEVDYSLRCHDSSPVQDQLPACVLSDLQEQWVCAGVWTYELNEFDFSSESKVRRPFSH